MSSPFLAEKKIAIVGLGLMGGSLALALRGHCAQILAADTDPQTLSFARLRRMVDLASQDAREILPQADIIVLAAPVRSILELIDRLPNWHAGSPLVLDLGSTKVQICERLSSLPARFHALGGHPMCGKEQNSIHYAEKDLFSGAPFALCALPSSRPEDRQTAEALVSAIGAFGLWIAPDTHDRWVAASSHLPYLAANALAASFPAEAQPLVGPGLRSSSRLAESNIQMMTDILLTNRQAVLEQMESYEKQLKRLRRALESQSVEDLGSELALGRSNYQNLVKLKEKQ
jgi:prephenate dehydrogenase